MIGIKHLNDDYFKFIQQYIDQNAIRKNEEHVEIRFPQNFIEINKLIDIRSSQSIEFIKNNLKKTKNHNQLRLDTSQSFENHIKNKWSLLSSTTNNVDVIIEQTLEYYRCHYGVSHFSIVKINDKVEFLHRFPYIQLLLEESDGNKEEFIKKYSLYDMNREKEWITPSILDLMHYPLIYTLFNGYYLTQPLHSHHSRLSIHFFKAGNFPIDYCERENVINKFYPERFDNSRKDTEFLSSIFGNNSAIQSYELINRSIRYINNILIYIYDWNNWLDHEGYYSFERNLKAISLLYLIISSISHNKFITNDFVKLANTFRSLDLLSNLIVALSKNENTGSEENKTFNKLFDFEDLVTTENLFYDCNHFKLICEKALSSAKNFKSTYGDDIFKEFRNYFTHGTFDSNGKRFELLLKCPLPPYEINFIPILWIAILGASPSNTIKFFQKN